MEHESDLDAANGLTQAERVAANALGDDDAFVEIPALRMSGKQEHDLRVVSHAAQTLLPTQHEPHVRRLERNLAFARLEEIASDGSDLIELDGFESGHNVGPATVVDTQRRELTFQGGNNETAYNRAQEEEWQHEEMPFKNQRTTKQSALVTCVQSAKIVLDSTVQCKDIFLQIF